MNEVPTPRTPSMHPTPSHVVVFVLEKSTPTRYLSHSGVSHHILHTTCGIKEATALEPLSICKPTSSWQSFIALFLIHGCWWIGDLWTRVDFKIHHLQADRVVDD